MRAGPQTPIRWMRCASAGLVLGLTLAAPVPATVLYNVTDLGTFGGTVSEAFGVNAAGQVVGYANLSGDAHAHAFLYSGTMTDLGTLGGTFSTATSINATGQVVGQAA